VDACEYAALGKCGDGRFLPSAGELFQVGQEFAVRAAQAKREAAPRLPSPDCQYDSATRQRNIAGIIAGYEKLLADLRSRNPIDPDMATREVFHPIDHTKPPIISDSLRTSNREAVDRMNRAAEAEARRVD
jgi:hypothetical protein